MAERHGDGIKNEWGTSVSVSSVHRGRNGDGGRGMQGSGKG